MEVLSIPRSVAKNRVRRQFRDGPALSIIKGRRWCGSPSGVARSAEVPRKACDIHSPDRNGSEAFESRLRRMLIIGVAGGAPGRGLLDGASELKKGCDSPVRFCDQEFSDRPGPLQQPETPSVRRLIASHTVEEKCRNSRSRNASSPAQGYSVIEAAGDREGRAPLRGEH
jgi:hypothetical protein